MGDAAWLRSPPSPSSPAAKSAKSAAKSAKSAAKSSGKAQTRPKRAGRRRKPTHDEIAVSAYYIHLAEDGGDNVDHWLRAERELKAG